jgi:hypothetical protein
VDRFVGELLQAKARKGGTGRFGRAMSKRYFLNGIDDLDNVLAVRDGLKKLDYLIHTPGYPVYGRDFDNPDKHEQRKGEAAKFEATSSLLELAAQCGVTLSQIHRHFPLEHQPIEARASSINDWRGKDPMWSCASTSRSRTVPRGHGGKACSSSAHFPNWPRHLVLTTCYEQRAALRARWSD